MTFTHLLISKKTSLASFVNFLLYAIQWNGVGKLSSTWSQTLRNIFKFGIRQKCLP